MPDDAPKESAEHGFTSEPVAAAAARLEDLAGRPLAEHPDMYQQIHSDLQRALADIDDV